MKVNKIRLAAGRNVDLPIVGADPSGPFVLKGADGLGPAEKDIRLAESILEGATFQGMRTHNRQVVLRVGLQPNWDTGQTAAELRDMLYSLLAPRFGRPLRHELFWFDTLQAYAEGYISKMEPAIFTSDPEVNVTIDCTHPYFKAPVDQIQQPVRTLVEGKSSFIVENDGTARTGFWLGITLQSPQTEPLSVSDEAADGEKFEVGGTWAAGDTLVLNTRAGERSIFKIPSGSTGPVSVLNDITKNSVWLQLYEGDNQLRVNNTAFDWYSLGFVHRPEYEGI